MRYLRFLFPVLLVAVVLASARAGDNERVTGQIRGFYQWYFHLLNTTPGESDIKQHRREFSRYVTAAFLKKIAHPGDEGQEGDAFFRQPDWNPDWEKNIEISRVKIGAKGGATAEVLLSGKEMPSKRLKVTLMLEGGTYKIANVETVRDETPAKPTEAAPTATP